MTLFEIIFSVCFMITFLGVFVYVVFAVKPKEEPHLPPFELPKEFVLRVIHEQTPIKPKELSKEDEEFLKKRDEEARAMTKEYNQFSETINETLDKLTGAVKEGDKK